MKRCPKQAEQKNISRQSFRCKLNKFILLFAILQVLKRVTRKRLSLILGTYNSFLGHPLWMPNFSK